MIRVVLCGLDGISQHEKKQIRGYRMRQHQIGLFGGKKTEMRKAVIKMRSLDLRLDKRHQETNREDNIKWSQGHYIT